MLSRLRFWSCEILGGNRWFQYLIPFCDNHETFYFKYQFWINVKWTYVPKLSRIIFVSDSFGD